MSGPKVVRIVTREEILEICRGHLARVDAALAEWIGIGKRNECIDDDALVAAQARREALAHLLAQARFEARQTQAPIEETFCRDDLQPRHAMGRVKQGTRRMMKSTEPESTPRQ